jgi:hypothetical protein
MYFEVLDPRHKTIEKPDVNVGTFSLETMFIIQITELVGLVGSALCCGEIRRKTELKRGNQIRSGERHIQRGSESVIVSTERKRNWRN